MVQNKFLKQPREVYDGDNDVKKEILCESTTKKNHYPKRRLSIAINGKIKGDSEKMERRFSILIEDPDEINNSTAKSKSINPEQNSVGSRRYSIIFKSNSDKELNENEMTHLLEKITNGDVNNNDKRGTNETFEVTSLDIELLGLDIEMIPKIPGCIVLPTTTTAMKKNMTKKATATCLRNKSNETSIHLKPSFLDIIIGSSSSNNTHEGIELEAYLRTLYVDEYRLAENTLEQALIVCKVIDSVKEMGGKFLAEHSNNKEGYYEVDDWFASEKIKGILKLSTSYI